MILSKSKQALADAIHASGKGWPGGANWAAQDGDGTGSIDFFIGDKPKLYKRDKFWRGEYEIGNRIHKCEKTIPNWHQTVLSRDEYFSAYPEKVEPVADTDGWIEWSGVAKSPVCKGVAVDVKMKNGTHHFGQLVDDECWGGHWGDASIIAYRLHKPVVDAEFFESVTRCIPDPDVPTTDQLLVAWKSAQSATREARTAFEAAEQAEREAEEAVKAALGKYGWGELVVNGGEIRYGCEGSGRGWTRDELVDAGWTDEQIDSAFTRLR